MVLPPEMGSTRPFSFRWVSSALFLVTLSAILRRRDSIAPTMTSVVLVGKAKAYLRSKKRRLRRLLRVEAFDFAHAPRRLGPSWADGPCGFRLLTCCLTPCMLKMSTP